MKKTVLMCLMALLCACTPTQPPATATLAPTPAPAPTDTPPPPPPDSPLSPEPTPTVETRDILMIIPPVDFNDDEFERPRAAFEAAGYNVVVASVSNDVAIGMFGTQVQPDIVLSDVDVGQYIAVVFVGGNGASVYWDDVEAHRVAQETVEQAKLLAAICIAPVTLARAQTLQDVQATVFDPSSMCSELETEGAICTGVPVQRDGLIITAEGPSAIDEFIAELMAALQE